MKDDLISRQAAIELFKDDIAAVNELNNLPSLPSAQPGCEDAVYRKAVQMLLAYFVPEERYAEAVDGLRRLPSAQPGWIPVTERLPENGYWLWSANGGEVKKDFYWNGHWELAEKYGYEVLAWMPLPKPWENE